MLKLTLYCDLNYKLTNPRFLYLVTLNLSICCFYLFSVPKERSSQPFLPKDLCDTLLLDLAGFAAVLKNQSHSPNHRRNARCMKSTPEPCMCCRLLKKQKIKIMNIWETDGLATDKKGSFSNDDGNGNENVITKHTLSLL